MNSQTRDGIRAATIHLLQEQDAYNFETGLNYHEIVEGIMNIPQQTIGRLGAHHIKQVRYSYTRMCKILVKPGNVKRERKRIRELGKYQTRYYLTSECEAK